MSLAVVLPAQRSHPAAAVAHDAVLEAEQVDIPIPVDDAVVGVSLREIKFRPDAYVRSGEIGRYLPDHLAVADVRLEAHRLIESARVSWELDRRRWGRGGGLGGPGAAGSRPARPRRTGGRVWRGAGKHGQCNACPDHRCDTAHEVASRHSVTHTVFRHTALRRSAFRHSAGAPRVSSCRAPAA